MIDALVGAVLPFSVLLALHEYRNSYSDMEEAGGFYFSLEREVNPRCDGVKQVASEMAVSDSGRELHEE
jgi:hypothetical protein